MKTSVEHEAATSALLELIKDMVREHCTEGDNLNSHGRPANAAAMRELNRRNIVLFVRDGREEIIGLWRKDEPEL